MILLKDKRGQLSLEYLLSAMMVILLISLLSIPLLSSSLDYSNDIIDSINAKNEVNKITNAIDYCYSSGKGSKKVVLIDLNRKTSIRFSNNLNGGTAYVAVDLSDGSSKEISSTFAYDKLNKNMQVPKGFSKIMVEWNEDSGLIEVNRVY